MQDITWLQDATYAVTIGAGSNGTFSQVEAVAWVSGIEFGGYDDWRLPSTPLIDSSCSRQIAQYGFDLVSDEADCEGSEMGHLFNVDGITPSPPR